MEGPSAWSLHNSLDLVGNQYAHESRGKHEQRLLLKGRSSPYPPNKEKGRYDDESDRSLSSLSSVRELMLKEAKANLCLPFLRERMLP